jgi:hypothetical protein
MADLENPERLVKLRAQWGSPGPEAAERALGELSRDAEHAAGAIARHEQQWQEALGRLWEMTAERSG